jgi:Family of unknown function (DUF5677)
MNGEVIENVDAFRAQIDDIIVTDVSPERLQPFTSEDDFNAITVELLIEVGSYVCVAGNLFPAETNNWDRNQAILGGHLVRLYKLVSALLDQICQHRRETTFIIARLAFECIVNLRYLLRFADDPRVFDSYVAYSLRQEKRLHERIHENINNRRGEVLPIEARMLNSIAKTVAASATRIEDLSVSRPKNWADKNLYERADEIGLGEMYLGTFGGASASVHGNWMDLLEMHLEYHDSSDGFTPDFTWSNPRPQIANTIALLTTGVVKDYFHHLSEGPSELMDGKLDDLFDRIRKAMELHENFLNRPRK